MALNQPDLFGFWSVSPVWCWVSRPLSENWADFRQVRGATYDQISPGSKANDLAREGSSWLSVFGQGFACMMGVNREG